MANDLPDHLLSDDQLREALGARPFRFTVQVGSTNDIARDWAIAGAPTGAIVLTEEQLAGRGRFGRAWSAPPGTALLMSIILHPRLLPDYQLHLARMTMVGAVAVTETLEGLIGDLSSIPQPLSSTQAHLVTLKWPNDVLLAGRKVAGILPEAIWEGQTLKAVILGIGLNVRVDFAGSGLEDRATNVESVIGSPVDRLALLRDMLARVDYWAARTKDSVLLDTWRSRLETIGKHIVVHGVTHGAGGEIGGEAVAVDEDGALLLRTDDGTIRRIVAGEVTLSGV